LICLDGTRAGNGPEGVHHQRHDQEDSEYRDVLGRVGVKVAGPITDVIEGDGARHRRRQRQPDPHPVETNTTPNR
jgi:hypothetical protein